MARRAGTNRVVTGKAPPERSALKPYWGKPAVRNFREGEGNNGIIEARSAPSPYSTDIRIITETETFREPVRLSFRTQYRYRFLSEKVSNVFAEDRAQIERFGVFVDNRSFYVGSLCNEEPDTGTCCRFGSAGLATPDRGIDGQACPKF